MKYWMGLGILLVGSALFVLGCATNQPKDEVAGHPSFKVLCSKCHTLERVEAMHNAISAEEMKAVVQRMAEKEDSGIDPHSIDDIVKEIY